VKARVTPRTFLHGAGAAAATAAPAPQLGCARFSGCDAAPAVETHEVATARDACPSRCWVGLLVPLSLDLWEKRPVLLDDGSLHAGRLLAGVSAALVLFGGFVLRYVFVYAGQTSSFQ
jgi:hypothetical protein